MSGQLEIKLVEKEDKNGDEYYIGSTDMPVLVDLSKVTLVVFHPTDDDDRATLILRTRKPKPGPRPPKGFKDF
jgi:hypothetical protein